MLLKGFLALNFSACRYAGYVCGQVPSRSSALGGRPVYSHCLLEWSGPSAAAGMYFYPKSPQKAPKKKERQLFCPSL